MSEQPKIKFKPITKEELEKEEKENKKKVKNKTSKKESKNTIDKKIQTKDKIKKKKRREPKKKFKILLSIILILIIFSLSMVIYNKYQKKREYEEYKNNLKDEITSHYNEFVITNKQANIYKLNNNKYESVGKIGNNQELTLKEEEITYTKEYYKITS